MPSQFPGAGSSASLSPLTQSIRVPLLCTCVPACSGHNLLTPLIHLTMSGLSSGSPPSITGCRMSIFSAHRVRMGSASSQLCQLNL
jgi:hypothetical protein